MKELNINGLGDLPDAAEEILAMLDRRNVVYRVISAAQALWNILTKTL